MPTDSRDRSPTVERRGAVNARKRPTARGGFHKERATLWLLTVTLGLGLGAAARFVQRADRAQAARAGASGVGSTQAQANASVPFQSQSVTMLPQQTYRPRATTRMS